jgi:thiamine kinase-like enzyme
VHHAVSRRLFYKEVASEAFDVCRKDMEYLVMAIGDIESKLKVYQELNLPKQLIHGDLHYDNILCDGENGELGLGLELELELRPISDSHSTPRVRVRVKDSIRRRVKLVISS